MQVELKITATTQKEAAILASTAGFLADVMGGDDTPVSTTVSRKLPAETTETVAPKKEKAPAPAAAEPKATKGPGRPKKAPEPEPIEELDDETVEEIDDDLTLDDDGTEDDDINLDDEETDEVETPAPKKSKTEKAPAKISQKQIIEGFKNYANTKGRDAGVALLKKYNVKSSREIKESDYPAFLKILSK